MAIFSIKHASIKHKVGGLFVVLLSFLFCVIVYSVYKLKVLEGDMKEVAYLDIPLSQIVTQIEFIELEQHLQLEEYRIQKQAPVTDLKPHQELVFQKRKLKKLLDKAVGLLENSLAKHELVLDAPDHKTVLAQLDRYKAESERFEIHLNKVYSQVEVSNSEIALVEQMSSRLEVEEKQLLSLLSQLVTTDAYYTAKHEQDFLVINSILGVCALILGLCLTVYIVQIIVKRVQSIQRHLQTIAVPIDDMDSDSASSRVETKDELEVLEYEVKALMSKLTKEIASREEVEQQLMILATRDKLTGLYNRHKWDEEIQRHVTLAQSGYLFGLIVLDIDYFKRINDQHGHQAGDKLLKYLAKELLLVVREVDLVFRLGGEEFAIICPLHGASSLLKLANDVRVMVEQCHIDDLPTCTVSAGVAVFKANDSVSTLFKRADMALYQAKAQGRNQVVCTDNELG
jgi:diguanylate cyclase (GGDEF)-like protein